MTQRPDGREFNQLRPVTIETGIQKDAEGSVLISTGDTSIICAASVEDTVPGFLKGTGEGWVSAEYSMLPRATNVRSRRERNRIGGRTQEIQRLIGRVMRAAVDLSALEERTIWLDCDVLQADGGTRTASITGAWLALALACRRIREDGHIKTDPVTAQIAAVSVGIYNGEPILDLNYQEDFAAEVDMNIAMTDGGNYVEIQGTAEKATFGSDSLASLLSLARKGIEELQDKQNEILKA